MFTSRQLPYLTLLNLMNSSDGIAPVEIFIIRLVLFDLNMLKIE